MKFTFARPRDMRQSHTAWRIRRGLEILPVRDDEPWPDRSLPPLIDCVRIGKTTARSGLANEYEASRVGMSRRVQVEISRPVSRHRGGASRRVSDRRSYHAMAESVDPRSRGELGQSPSHAGAWGETVRAISRVRSPRQFPTSGRSPSNRVPARTARTDTLRLRPMSRHSPGGETGTRHRMPISGRCRPPVHTRATGRQSGRRAARPAAPWSVREPWDTLSGLRNRRRSVGR